MLKAVFLVLIFYANFAYSLRMITDAETENVIKAFITPLVKAAKLNPDNISIRLIVDPEINAFVIGGGDVFINTGLIITFADDPNILYGVMAHEIAHLYAGHIIAKRGEHEDMSKVAIGGAILGLATALAGAPEAGFALGMASASGAHRHLMHYSRIHETEADKIAVNLLYKTQNNGQGLIKLFRYLARHDRMYSDIDPYAITHPLSMERITSIENAIKSKLSQFPDNISAATHFEFRRIANKLEAFLADPHAVLKKFKGNDYALSIGYFRSGQLTTALDLLAQIINKEPNNPYLWELKGQYYFDNGKFSKAKQCYQKALQYMPADLIFKVELAATLINQASNKDTQELSQAVMLLKQASAKQPNNVMAYFMLSRAYGKLGNQVQAILSLAEFYFYQGEYGRSKILAHKILKMTTKSSKEYLKASDIIEYLKVEKKTE